MINVKTRNIKTRFLGCQYSRDRLEKDCFFVIERVLNYGVWNDFKSLLQYYGDATIKQEIIKSAYLKKDVLNFVCFYFDLKISQFKCYKRRQSQEKHWNY